MKEYPDPEDREQSLEGEAEVSINPPQTDRGSSAPEEDEQPLYKSWTDKRGKICHKVQEIQVLFNGNMSAL